MAAWRPILEGERAGRAREQIGWLAGRLIDPGRIEAAALMSGLPGIALALDAIGDEARAGEHLEAAAAASGTLAGEAGLARGVAGLGFAFELCAGGGDQEGDDPNDAVDEALAAEVAGDPTVPAELLRGLAGRAVFARERRARPSGRALEEAIAARLLAMAESTPEGTAWRTAPDPRFADRALCDRHPHGWFDLGVAHGAPSIIAALAAAGAGDPARAGMDWMWRQRGPAGGPGFPALAGEEPRAQPGWCYGDEGIAAVLFAASRALGDEAWAGRWLDVLRGAAERRAPAGGAALCHGAAGLAHIYNRVHQATGLAWARDAALHRFAELEAALAGARDQLPAGLLDGLAGVALALAAALGDQEPTWDRALVLSLPAAG